MGTAIRLMPREESAEHTSRMPLHHAVHWRPRSALRPASEAAVSVFVTPKAYMRACAHAHSDLENEVGGWLLGRYRLDSERGERFVVVDTILPARNTRQGSAFLTFTPESQLELHRAIEEEYPGKALVGWFHTHPRMGIFLSAYDTFLHNHFFPELWQVALVIEPFSRSAGFFVRQPGGLLDPRRYYGFYELTTDRSRSVVHWQNLSARRAQKERSTQ
jgi:proteasome lid subunit RPN8/RPN11